MKRSLKKGLSFGLTSGIITTLGMIVGLDSSTHSQIVVIGGILTIAVADAFSDALGIHISEESENKHPVKEIWESTIATFLAKFLFAMTFIIPMLLFGLSTAIIASVIWGLFVLCILSYFIAREEKENPVSVVGEHLFIAIVVIIVTHYIGDMISIFLI
jgi:VIT1/CCC1 family predicted Fe2+/Mn2+ transporter